MINKKLLNKLDAYKPNNLHSCILYLLCIYYQLDAELIDISENDINLLRTKGFINRKTIRNKLRKIVVEDLEERVSNKEIVDRVNEFRHLFPDRGDKQIVIKKLIRWFTENNDMTFDEIIHLATRWVNLKGQFSGSANYFLYKDVKENGEIVTISRALEMLDLLEENSSFDIIL